MIFASICTMPKTKDTLTNSGLAYSHQKNSGIPISVKHLMYKYRRVPNYTGEQLNDNLTVSKTQRL